MSPKFPQVILLLILFTACKNDPKVKEIPLHFETVSVLKKSGEGCLTDDFDCTVISLDIPVAKGPEKVAANINNELKKRVFSLVFSEEPSAALTYEEYAKGFIANQQKTAAEFQESTPWKAIVTGTVVYKKENMVSISIDSEIFTGGAHGYRSLSYFNFNPRTGEVYEHNDIFKPGFANYAENAFRKQYNIPQEDSINSTGLWFEGDSFKLPLNIGFDSGKVILVYNSYEVASYAEGEFRLEFPLKEVAAFLKIELE